MLKELFKKIFKKSRKASREIFPEEIFMDSSNLPSFNRHQFEGRIEKPISRKTIYITGTIFFLIGALIVGKIWTLQIVRGVYFTEQSAQNRLKNVLIFPSRGIVYDRNKLVLVSNKQSDSHPEFPERTYKNDPGLGLLLGYLSYPKKDTAGYYFQNNLIGRDGIEQFFDGYLSGVNGAELIETDALGKIQSESVVYPARDGNSLTLSIDARVQKELYKKIADLVGEVHFEGGAGIIMDVSSGELLALANYPEYDSQIMTDGNDQKKLDVYRNDPKKPFLNRAIEGLYAPGSIVKPFLALAALQEKVIAPDKKILSTGSISIPNPYDKTKKSVFTDWRPQGYVDMRQALAVSSDVYFYEIGGGFENQVGLGIDRLNKYMKLFGFGAPVPGEMFSGVSGVVPDPAWKAKNFNGEIWRIGDTYNTSIGQYGTQVTPLQAVRAVAAIANGGRLLTPSLVLGTDFSSKNGQAEKLPIDNGYYEVVAEGMREAVLTGTAKGLYLETVSVAAKTGTAELGSKKQYVNSWVIGFFPYEKPRYAFAVVMEKGPSANLIGGLYVMRGLLDWMSVNTPEYLK